MGDKPLKEAHPRFYLINFDHNISVADAIEKVWVNFTFRRAIYAESFDLWNSLKARCEEIQMHGGKRWY